MAAVAEFPDCCAFIILNKFRGGHPGANPDDCITPKECEEFLKVNEQKYYGERAGLIACLSEPQNKRIGSVFLSRKWVLKMEGIMNPRSGTRVWMYFRDLNPTAAREKRIFGR